MEDKILNIPSMSMFNNDWDLLLKFVENEGNPPFHFDGDLYLLYKVKSQSLGTLVSVGGCLDLSNNVNITTLGNLVSVGGELNLWDCINLKSFGNLKTVGGNLIIQGTIFKNDKAWIKKNIDIHGVVYNNWPYS